MRKEESNWVPLLDERVVVKETEYRKRGVEEGKSTLIFESF
jgi:hypothetical protein